MKLIITAINDSKEIATLKIEDYELESGLFDTECLKKINGEYYYHTNCDTAEELNEYMFLKGMEGTSIWKKSKVKTYYYQSIGECISQVYKVEANSWDEAKKVAFADMDEGDILAECPTDAVKEDENYPEYHYIDEDMCTNYTKLCKGTWVTTESGSEYWESRAWYFDDATEIYLNGKGEEFTNWKKDNED